MATDLNITAGSLSSVCYPASAQTLYEEMMEKASALLPDGLGGVIISASTPAVADQNKLWIKLDGSANPVGRFIYQGGWIWPHEVPYSSSERSLWVGTTSALQTYDGGSVAAVSDTTGPFWEVDTDFNDKIPIGANAAGTAAVGVNAGASTVTLTNDNVPPHGHDIGVEISTNTGSSANGRLRAASTNVEWQGSTASTAIATTRNAGGTGSPAAAASFSIIPPVRGIYLIKRTARKFRTP